MHENRTSQCITFLCLFFPFQQTVFPKGGHYALKDLSATDYDVIGIDWTVNPAEARKIVGDGITLQGNLDPCALYASKVLNSLKQQRSTL